MTLLDTKPQTGQHRWRGRRTLRAVKFWTMVGLGIAVILGLGTVWAHGGVRSAGVAAFGAALGTGGVLGFLFGVPGVSRSPITINDASSVAVGTGNQAHVMGGTPPGTAPPAPVGGANGQGAPTVQPLVPGGAGSGVAATPPAQTPGASAHAEPGSAGRQTAAAGAPSPAISNLEQVADWVTKLLLGGGLTQLGRIPPKIWAWSRLIALGLLGERGGTEQAIVAQQAFAAGLLVYGFVLGFFAGFLITRLQLGRAITDQP